jgi:hypothetical protein
MPRLPLGLCSVIVAVPYTTLQGPESEEARWNRLVRVVQRPAESYHACIRDVASIDVSADQLLDLGEIQRWKRRTKLVEWWKRLHRRS